MHNPTHSTTKTLTAATRDKAARALAQAEAQRRLDRLHHEFRVAWLSADQPVWDCGTPVSKSDRHNMLADSRRILAGDPYVTGSSTGPQPSDPYAQFLEEWERERAERHRRSLALPG